jgi:hypothetical protein
MCIRYDGVGQSCRSRRGLRGWLRVAFCVLILNLEGIPKIVVDYFTCGQSL